ncbi:hypothetical protein J6590_007070 [Homalodisca vitripennis]|nr:hypothetical protein J6590_007070 [Homalodisca vitripennis]
MDDKSRRVARYWAVLTGAPQGAGTAPSHKLCHLAVVRKLLTEHLRGVPLTLSRPWIRHCDKPVRSCIAE